MHGSEFSQGSYGKQESQGELCNVFSNRTNYIEISISAKQLNGPITQLIKFVDFTLLNESVMCKVAATETQSLTTTIHYLLYR